MRIAIAFTCVLALTLIPAAQADVIDISASFNGDTLATDTSDSAGTGYRGAKNEKFLVNTGLPTDGVLTPAGGPTFQLGSYTANNTVLMESSGAASAVTLDIANQRLSNFSIVHSAVGFNTSPAGGQNGTATVTYIDGTTDNLTWDLADNDGNNGDGLSQDAVDGLTLRVFQNSTQVTGRQLWFQTFTGFNSAKTIESISFDSSAASADPDADFGLYAMSGTAAPFTPIDMSASFNRDTIAIDNAEPTGNGYRNQGLTFITTNHNDKGNTPNIDPSGELVADNTPFEFGPLDSPDTVQNNTLILDVDGNAGDGVGASHNVDVDSLRGKKLSVLFSAVGFNLFTGTPNNTNNNGFITVQYTSGADDVFEWDVADSDGTGRLTTGGSEIALAPIDLFDTDTDTNISAARNLFYQHFMIDPSRLIDSITLSVDGVIDGGGNDAEFGVYAMTVTVPEPASAMLLGLGGLALLRRR